MIKNIDVLQLKNRIKKEIKTRGDTDLECGYLKAKALLDAFNKNEDDIVDVFGDYGQYEIERKKELMKNQDLLIYGLYFMIKERI